MGAQAPLPESVRVVITSHFHRRYNKRVGRAARWLQRVEGLLVASEPRPLSSRVTLPMGDRHRVILARRDDGAWVAVTILGCRRTT